MPSYVAWLDTSAEAERRAREALVLRSDAEGRDELGLGGLRDAVSDAMFPGISAGQSRILPFLGIPWLFRYGEEHHKLAGTPLLRWVQRREPLLPIASYWPALIRYGILTADLGPDQLRRHRPVRRDDEAEPSTRPATTWIATLPEPPAGFPDAAPAAPVLHRPEAEWLRERILEAVPATVLAHVLRSADRVDPTSDVPWRDAAGLAATGAAGEWVGDARRCAIAVRGATLLVDLLLAERYDRAGLRSASFPAPVEAARDRLREWSDEVPVLAGWDRTGLWTRLRAVDRRLPASICSFVDAWVAALGPGTGDSPALRELVTERVRRVNRGGSPLANDRLLRVWAGPNGAAGPTFRWAEVRSMAREIADALA